MFSAAKHLSFGQRKRKFCVVRIGFVLCGVWCAAKAFGEQFLFCMDRLLVLYANWGVCRLFGRKEKLATVPQSVGKG